MSWPPRPQSEASRPACPFREEHALQLGPTTHSRWAYACSKELDEWLALAYLREKQVPVIVIRFFNTVGPRQAGAYGMVLPASAGQALRNEPITVYGTGTQSRCFGHVPDAVEALSRLIRPPDAVGGVFNIGTTEEISVNDLAAPVRDTAGSSSEIVHIPYAEAHAAGLEAMQRRVPGVSKLERGTGFRPSMSLERIGADVVAGPRARLERSRGNGGQGWRAQYPRACRDCDVAA